MIAMVLPTHSDVENAMNTLRYTDRVKELWTGDNGRILSNEDDEISNGTMSSIYINKVEFLLFFSFIDWWR
jgi:hypothetical protein